ncbi:uncharacterized protein P884DRAFT_306344 [Thermothelomyces heterothallicus CBS 202.75]|uniref:uncharacterized protein n=1 Tax=Thermothelomyces heterothallicus CBS 202.75 TaxID=1149848 RepID=UPI003743E62B
MGLEMSGPRLTSTGGLSLCAVTLLALAAVTIKEQVIDSASGTTRYSTFTGGFGMIAWAYGLRTTSNCTSYRRAQADEALQFFCFGMVAGLVAIGYLQMRRAGPGRGRTGAYVA